MYKKIAEEFLRKYAIIHHPPVNNQRYIKNVSSSLEKDWDLLQKNITSIRNSFRYVEKHLGEQDARYLFKDMGVSTSDIYQHTEMYLKRLQENHQHLLSVLKMFAKDDVRRNLVFVFDAMRYFSESLEIFSRNFLEHLEEIRFDYFYGSGYDDKTTIEYMSRVENSISQIKTIVVSFEKLITEVKNKFEALKHYYEGEREDGSDPFPKGAEKVETLYHASVDAANIFRKGFDPVVPEVKGLGGSRDDRSGKSAVSFTSSLYVAKEIARCLKEAVMISKGNVKFNDILEWAGKEASKTLEYYEYAFGRKREGVVAVMNLYRAYLSATPRYNPVFFGDMKELTDKLKRVNYKDVGVLECVVDIGTEEVRYLKSEYEFRVPPKNVLSIKRIIR